jgi:hypothetical protein
MIQVINSSQELVLKRFMFCCLYNIKRFLASIGKSRTRFNIFFRLKSRNKVRVKTIAVPIEMAVKNREKILPIVVHVVINELRMFDIPVIKNYLLLDKIFKQSLYGAFRKCGLRIWFIRKTGSLLGERVDAFAGQIKKPAQTKCL